MRATVSDTLSTKYSAGGAIRRVGAPRGPTQLSTGSGSTPDRMLLPHSIVSGRSVTSRSVTVGTPKMQHSSWTVPLSLSTQNAAFSKATKSKSPSGSTKRTLSADTPNDLIRSAVLGCSEHTTGMS